jgi:CrcB protein
LFLTTGIIGGFTTFSTFSLDAVTLWERGRHLAAIGYIFASISLSLTALAAVLLLMRR